MSEFLGLYPRLVLCAPLVLGRGVDREWTLMDAKGDGRMGQGNGYPQINADGGWGRWRFPSILPLMAGPLFWRLDLR